MTHTHAQLEQMLDALDESVPRLVQTSPAPGEFWNSFTSLAQTIQDHAQPGDRAWVCDRLDAIQVKHHLVPPADQI
jgi:hypothetical protein